MSEFCKKNGIPEGFTDFSVGMCYAEGNEVYFTYADGALIKNMKWDDLLELKSLWMFR